MPGYNSFEHSGVFVLLLQAKKMCAFRASSKKVEQLFIYSTSLIFASAIST